MRITEATEAEHDELVAMLLARFPRRTRSDCAWVFEETHNITHSAIPVARSDDGELLGLGRAVRAVFLPPTWCLAEVVVAPGHDAAGVGRALWAELDGRWGEGTTELRTMIFDDDERSLAVAAHWGFEVLTHGITSDLALVDLPTPVLPDDVTLEEAPDFGFPDPDAVERVLLDSQTNPEARTGTKTTLAQLASPPPPGAHPVVVVARIAGVPAGILAANVRDGDLSIHYTGIDPAFRGRGLAVLVKQHAHLRAAELGATRCRTTNEVTNAGIRRINAELGYVVQYGAYRLRKMLG